jgi:hypothetical protein
MVSRPLELEQIAQPVVDFMAVIDAHRRQPTHVSYGYTICFWCGDKARCILLPYMRLMTTLPQPWYLLEVHTAQGSPFMWNNVLGTAKSEYEFHGQFVKGAKGLGQLTGFNHMLRPRALPPIADKLRYIREHLREFWRARQLLRMIRQRFDAPKLDCEGWVAYYAKDLPGEVERWHKKHGSHWHGTRLQCLNNILVNGLRDSNSQLTDGVRTLGDGRKYTGVYFYNDREWATESYCPRQDFVGDQVYWAFLIDAAVDWNQRITPTLRQQIVIPERYVRIRSLRFNIWTYQQLPDQSLIVPVWVPMLEAAYR